MQHKNFYHEGRLIDLSHLDQRCLELNWDGKQGSHGYRVWVRYSNHCYSKEPSLHESGPITAHVVATEPRMRVYCPDRYAQTHRLTGMIAGLFAKPTSKVALTRDRNWTIFQLYLPQEKSKQERYCAFFRVKNSARQPDDSRLHFLDMHVESAYVRTNTVKTIRTCPFGEVAHMTKYRIPYF